MAKDDYEGYKCKIMQEGNSDLEKKSWHGERSQYPWEIMRKGNELPPPDEVPKRYACSECPLSFDKTISRFTHMKTVHFPGKYPCTVCDMKFPNSQDLKHHILVHQDETGAFSCDVCGKTMKKATVLRDIRNFLKSCP